MTARTAATDRPEQKLGPRVTVSTSPARPGAGEVVTVTATVSNVGDFTLRGTVLYVTRSNARETVRPLEVGDLRPGASASRSRRIQLPVDAEGVVTFAAHALFDGGFNGPESVQSGIDVTLPYFSLRSAFNNSGIAEDDNPAAADVDGAGASFSADALATVGCVPGATLSHDGVKFTWPEAEPGQPDNVVCAGQTVLLNGSGSRLAFLGACTHGAGCGDGAVRYQDGSVQRFSVAVQDWSGPGQDAAVVAPYRNAPRGRENAPVSAYFFAVPLHEGKPLSAVVLPTVAGAADLHLFAMSLA